MGGCKSLSPQRMTILVVTKEELLWALLGLTKADSKSIRTWKQPEVRPVMFLWRFPVAQVIRGGSVESTGRVLAILNHLKSFLSSENKVGDLHVLPDLIYPETGNSWVCGFRAADLRQFDRRWVVSPGVKYAHRNYKKTPSMEPRLEESPWQRGRRGLRFLTPIELNILMRSYSLNMFWKSSRRPRENIAVWVNGEVKWWSFEIPIT